MITENQYKVFRRLVSLTQKELKEDVSKTLRKYYQEVEETEDYIYAKGDIDIALLAHLDTVHVTPVEQLFFDKQQSVVWSPEGLGADDRAGVYAIIQIIEKGYRPHIIFNYAFGYNRASQTAYYFYYQRRIGWAWCTRTGKN